MFFEARVADYLAMYEITQNKPIMKKIILLCLATLSLVASAQTITGKYEIPKVPEWAKNAVFYQIYPQTFCDSDGDGIGDLKGIISKLDYVKSLGVDAIWFNPFFDSPFMDAGYDIRDYYKIAPRYGTNDDARQLFEEVHKRGMHVIFDYVISYTSIDNPWFVESQKQKKNKYSNYYIWTETNWVDPPREFAGQFIKGYGRRNGQFMRNFYWCQPALNFGFSNPDPDQPWQLPTNHPDVLAMREDLKNVLRFWMDMGADGFRADMAVRFASCWRRSIPKASWWRSGRILPMRSTTASTLTSSIGSTATTTCSRRRVGAFSTV